MNPNDNFKVFNEDIEFKLTEISNLISAALPKGWGFTLLLFDFNNSKGSLFYSSNGQREDIIKMMKEFIVLAEKQDKTIDGELPPE